MQNHGFVVYNDELYCVNGYNGRFSKLTPLGWQYISATPFSYYGCTVVVFNREIHILGDSFSGGGNNPSDNHYKWDGTTWEQASTLPYSFSAGGVVVYNNELYLIGGISPGGNKQNNFYKWDGTTWTKLTNMPLAQSNFCTVVYNNKIHVLGGLNGYSDGYRNQHYSWDGATWSKESDLPYDFYHGMATVYNGKIHIIGDWYDGNTVQNHSRSHYSWDGTSWVNEGNIDINNNSSLYNGVALVYGGRLRLFTRSSAVLVNDIWLYSSDNNDDITNDGGNVIIPVFEE